MIEIIPKPVKKIPNWQNIIFYFSLALLIVAILSYFIMANFEKKASVELQNLDDEIAEVGTREEKALETEVFANKRRISDFSKLFAKHQKSSNFFELLEGIIHPNVWLATLDLNLETRRAVISGRAPNFQTLGQQLSIFQAKDSIQKVELPSLSLGAGGEARFNFNLSLDPQIFK